MGFPENLKRLRVRSGMTQKELSKEVGVSDRTIQLYEAGEVVPKTEISRKLAEVLLVDFDELMGYDTKVITPKQGAEKIMRDIKSLFYGGDFDLDEKEEYLRVINQTFYDAKRQIERRETRKSKK